MYYYYLVASFFLLAPWLLFIGMAVISKPVEESQTKYGKSRGLCTSPGCVRCNRNKQELQHGKERLQKLYRGDAASFERIHRALDAGDSPLFLELDFPILKSVWAIDQLPSDVEHELRMLEEAAPVIASECDDALKNAAYLWRRNEEPTTNSCWFVFPLINQGEWQEQQCRCVPQLVDQLHQLHRNLLVDCLFGNAFISMLPAGMEIAQHRGMTNARLRVHLGVEIPSDSDDTCFMLVGDKKLNWKSGRCLVFDDSYPHSVTSKRCRQDRIVVSLDIWNPQLSLKERECLCKIFPAITSA